MKIIKILIVCQWPLGGIRTYLKYNYNLFLKDEFEVTLLANSSIESNAVEEDMTAAGVRVIWAKPFLGKQALSLRLFLLLLKENFDLIHSQGFISSLHVSLVNWIFRIPHVLTIHGILEDRYFKGKFGWLKRVILKNSMRNITVFHGVGQDILDHLQNTFPDLRKCKAKWIVITNGIEYDRFIKDSPDAKERIRTKYDIDENIFLFGFFGRFMPQKGFNYIIDAVEILINKGNQPEKFIIIAVGSGDYIREYKIDVKNKKLMDCFMFIPFIPDIADTMKACDAILMPSIWEAWGLLASEVLCSGIPLIASDCIGLREAIKDTPAITIPSHNAGALAEAMLVVMNKPEIKDRFISFRDEAAKRFDVKHSAEKLMELFREIVN